MTRIFGRDTGAWANAGSLKAAIAAATAANLFQNAWNPLMRRSCLVCSPHQVLPQGGLVYAESDSYEIDFQRPAQPS
jgi:hypothetical protein